MQKINKRILAILVLCLLILIVFTNWFSLHSTSSGDFNYFYSSMYADNHVYPYIWSSMWGNGLGGVTTIISWVNFDFALPIALFGKLLHLEWEYIQKIAYFYPFLMLAICSPAFFMRKHFPNNTFYLLSSGIFLFNTYILMVVGGGQILISLSYALAFFAINFFFTVINNIFDSDIPRNLWKQSLILGLGFSVQLILDPRIAYITFLSIGLYGVFKVVLYISPKDNINFLTNTLKKIVTLTIFVGIIPLSITALLHMFWLLPVLLSHTSPINQLSDAYTTTNAVDYFSFAKIENTAALLHPNWPENIFGKTGFMKAEYLLLPLLAFSYLFFINTKGEKKEEKNENVLALFFVLLGLLGIFLAKGSQQPFGQVYLWLFQYFPGFILFRDPTKWYLLIAISYSVLIPLTIQAIYTKLQKKIFISKTFVFLVVTSLLLLIYPALSHQLKGTFVQNSIPHEHRELERMVASQTNFFRLVWFSEIPTTAYSSNIHPNVNAFQLLHVKNLKEIRTKIKEKNVEQTLKDISTKYIILADITNFRSKDEQKAYHKEYLQTISELDTIPWLKRVSSSGRITIYILNDYKDHFWSPNKTTTISYTYINPVTYKLNINAEKDTSIIFAENFDKNWVLETSDKSFKALPYSNLLNQFTLQKGTYSAVLSYSGQKWTDLGILISMSSLLTISFAVIINRKKI